MNIWEKHGICHKINLSSCFIMILATAFRFLLRVSEIALYFMNFQHLSNFFMAANLIPFFLNLPVSC